MIRATFDPQPLWREIQRQQFSRLDPLCDFLQLSPLQRSQLDFSPRFPLLVPLRLAEKMEKGTLDDPITKQFLPLKKEQDCISGFNVDPVCDHGFRKERRLLQKYEGRCLLICTGACAMHCRYCFRQNFDYTSEKQDFADELDAIRSDTSLREVILSGGDPLSLSDRALEPLLQELDRIPHVKRIRFHTRFPIGIPERIDDSFLKIIASLSKQCYFVIHCNHAKELDETIFFHLNRLRKLGCVILNQCVLLKEVNDTFEVQKELCETLVDHGVLPYYLHQLDKVQGAAHFEVDPAIGLQLIQQLTHSLSGYAVPRYVQEIAGEPSKTPL